MKYVLFLSLSLLGASSFAEQVKPGQVVSESACSSWISASPYQHEISAVANVKEKLAKSCGAIGYTGWNAITQRCRPSLFGIPCYCVEATVVCR